MDDDTINRFTLAVLVYADEERQREKARRSLLDVVTRHPDVVARTMLQTVAAVARRNQRYLWSAFRFDVKRNRWRKNHTAPSSEEDWVRFWDARQMWHKQMTLIGAWRFGAEQAYQSGQVVGAGAIQEFVYADRMLIWPDGCDIVLCPWRQTREESTARFAGTILARINLAKNKRLWAALSPGSVHDQQLELARRLPGAIAAALHAGGPHEHPQTVMNRAVRLIECEQRPRRSYRPRRNRRDGPPASWPEAPWMNPPRYDPLPLVIRWVLEGQDNSITDEVLREAGYGSLGEQLQRLTPDILRSIGDAQGLDVSPLLVPMIEQFAARETVASGPSAFAVDEAILNAAAVLAAEHDMTGREAQVFALKGAHLTHQEIGEVLGISAGTSKALLSRAKKKVGRIA